MRKTYYYKIFEKKPRNAGGYNVQATVYVVKAGKIIKIGDIKWNTASYKGETSVVYDLLADKKLVSAKEFKSNNGYYYSSKSKVDIREF